MVKLFSLKSPDEWATTKQACRDTYVVTCFLPSTIRILALLYVLSTVLRISSSNLLYIYISICTYILNVSWCTEKVVQTTRSCKHNDGILISKIHKKFLSERCKFFSLKSRYSNLFWCFCSLILIPRLTYIHTYIYFI